MKDNWETDVPAQPIQKSANPGIPRKYLKKQL